MKKYCDYCGKKPNAENDLFQFIARRTGTNLAVCEACLDGENADYFENIIAKSLLIPVEV